MRRDVYRCRVCRGWPGDSIHGPVAHRSVHGRPCETPWLHHEHEPQEADRGD